ncbi:MAG: hypothetical protein ACI95X_001785, partial [Paraglaciecola sp.]
PVAIHSKKSSTNYRYTPINYPDLYGRSRCVNLLLALQHE